MPTFPDFVRAPNIAGSPAVYERENAAIDPSGALWRALRERADWAGRTLVDLGCGTGFWLPRYASEPDAPAAADVIRAEPATVIGGEPAGAVIGVEPDPELVALARDRVAGLDAVEVRAGSAERLPLPDSSVDVVHARFAYFFPPHCGPGLREVRRVLRPGGALVVIDNDWRRGEFAELLRASYWARAQGSAQATDDWWAAEGADRTEVMSGWRCADAAELESVLRIEFPPELVDDWIADHPGRAALTYGYVLFTSAKG